MKCWRCGKKEATRVRYGYPVCEECAKDLDPEEMEEVLTEALSRHDIRPLDEIHERRND